MSRYHIEPYYDRIIVVFDNIYNSAPVQEIIAFFSQKNAFSMVLLLIIVILLATFLSRYIAKGIIFIAQRVSTQSDNTQDELQKYKLRQVETYLSISIAVVRVLVVAVVAYVTWRIISPNDNPTGVADIGASSLFIVFAGQSLGMLLRDVTAGATMIIEGWFTVGDYIKVEPFMELSGVVERFTLRSTKIRSLSGEVVWVNNQHMQAVHVTPRGVRTIAVDVFSKDEVRAKEVLETIITTIPTGTMLLAKPLKITRVEKWNNGTTRFTIVGQTAPGREWLIQDFLVSAIEDIDRDVDRRERLFTYKPFSRFADETATKKFQRAVRAQKN